MPTEGVRVDMAYWRTICADPWHAACLANPALQVSREQCVATFLIESYGVRIYELWFNDRAAHLDPHGEDEPCDNPDGGLVMLTTDALGARVLVEHGFIYANEEVDS